MSGRWLAWVLCPLLAAALVLEAGRARRTWRASLIAATIKDVTIEASERGRLSRQLLLYNLEQLRVIEPLSPVEVALPIARGGQYLLLDRPQAAIRAYRHALTIEPRGEIYAHLGRAYLALGDARAAQDAFRQAVILDHTQRKRVLGYVGDGVKQPDPGAAVEEADPEPRDGDSTDPEPDEG